MQIIYKKQSIGNRPEKILMWYAGFYEKMNILCKWEISKYAICLFLCLPEKASQYPSLDTLLMKMGRVVLAVLPETMFVKYIKNMG